MKCLVLTMSLVACSGSNNSSSDADIDVALDAPTADAVLLPDAGPMPTTSAEAWCDVYLAYHCGFSDSCCTQMVLAWPLIFDCQTDREAMRQRCIEDERPLSDSVVHFDPAQFITCQNAMQVAANSCGSANLTERNRDFDAVYAESCSGMLTGTIGEAAGACSYDEECAPGLDCSEILTTDSPSQCRPIGGAGTECYTNDQCAHPLICDGECKVASPGNGACAGSPTQCESDLYCDLTNNICLPLLAAGTTCNDVNSPTDPCRGHCDGFANQCIATCTGS